MCASSTLVVIGVVAASSFRIPKATTSTRAKTTTITCSDQCDHSTTQMASPRTSPETRNTSYRTIWSVQPSHTWSAAFIPLASVAFTTLAMAYLHKWPAWGNPFTASPSAEMRTTSPKPDESCNIFLPQEDATKQPPLILETFCVHGSQLQPLLLQPSDIKEVLSSPHHHTGIVQCIVSVKTWSINIPSELQTCHSDLEKLLCYI